MNLIRNLIAALAARIRLIMEGLGALVALPGAVMAAPGAGLGPKAAAAFGDPKNQRRAFSLLRAFQPNLVLSRTLVKAYPNSGTVIVSRSRDVEEVLSREADFEVVYEPRMRKITAGENFFLGMQDGPAYTRDTTNMRWAMRRDDVAGRVAPAAAKMASEIVAAAGGSLDVPVDLTLRVPTAMVGDYFGIPAKSEADMIAWATDMFWWLFVDLAAKPEIEVRALAGAAACRQAIDEEIARRKAAGEAKDDVLGRCLELQRAGTPGMDDLGIRNNIIGLIIGAIPTLSKSSNLALDQLLDRPDALADAQAAARKGDEAAVGAHLFEALRFSPANPVIYRRAVRDTWIAAETLRARRVKAGAMVMAGNFSAMFDPLAVENPGAFRTDRPWSNYILWGYGMHVCFGAHINRAVIPAMLTPLLARPGLRRTPGAAGRLDSAGTPFPAHLRVEWDQG